VPLVMTTGHLGDAFVAQVCNDLHERFGISHAAAQVETDPSYPCTLVPENLV
jgi:cobalt-zinc-cadmium efflux system protein